MILDIDTFTLYFYKIDTHTHTISIKIRFLWYLVSNPAEISYKSDIDTRLVSQNIDIGPTLVWSLTCLWPLRFGHDKWCYQSLCHVSCPYGWNLWKINAHHVKNLYHILARVASPAITLLNCRPMHNGAVNFPGIMLLLFWASTTKWTVLGLSNVYNMYLIPTSYIKCLSFKYVARTNNLLVVYLHHNPNIGWHLPSKSIGSHIWRLGIYGHE